MHVMFTTGNAGKKNILFEAWHNACFTWEEQEMLRKVNQTIQWIPEQSPSPDFYDIHHPDGNSGTEKVSHSAYFRSPGSHLAVTIG